MFFFSLYTATTSLKDNVQPGLRLIATVQKCNEMIRVKKTVQQLKTDLL